jgi:hypothetical protein
MLQASGSNFQIPQMVGLLTLAWQQVGFPFKITFEMDDLSYSSDFDSEGSNSDPIVYIQHSLKPSSR